MLNLLYADRDIYLTRPDSQKGHNIRSSHFSHSPAKNPTPPVPNSPSAFRIIRKEEQEDCNARIILSVFSAAKWSKKKRIYSGAISFVRFRVRVRWLTTSVFFLQLRRGWQCTLRATFFIQDGKVSVKSAGHFAPGSHFPGAAGKRCFRCVISRYYFIFNAPKSVPRFTNKQMWPARGLLRETRRNSSVTRVTVQTLSANKLGSKRLPEVLNARTRHYFFAVIGISQTREPERGSDFSRYCPLGEDAESRRT